MHDTEITNLMGFTAAEVGLCTYCDEVPELDLEGPHHFGLSGCCTEAHEALACGWSWADVYGVELAAAAASLGVDVRRTADGDAGEVIAVHSLTVEEEPSRKRVRAFVAEHHRHSKSAPVADRARFCVYNGPTLVAVAMLGNPVSRMLAAAEPGTLEVTRVCAAGESALRRNACSMLYAAAARWAKAHGFAKVITYTRADELATTMRAAGWEVEVERTRGGSWDRAARPRARSANEGPKVRWCKAVAS